MVLVSTQEYGGNGKVFVNTDNIGSGTFDIQITNVGTATLNALAKISFLIL